MKDILIRGISHQDQRYSTVGDYEEFEKQISIRISEMSDERYMFLVALHELIELTLCRHRKISFNDIDKFDVNFESERLQGLHKPDEEPGDSKDAPYFMEHQFATIIEKVMAIELDVNWDEYAKKWRVYELF